MPLQQYSRDEKRTAPLESLAPVTAVTAPQFGETLTDETLTDETLTDETLTDETVEMMDILDMPRYDAAAVRQIIALAEQMQARHQHTLSSEEIEALGHELGIEPAFVRRALNQAAQSQAKETGQGVHGETNAVHAKKQRTGRKRQVVPRPSASELVRGPAWYLLAMSATLPWVFINDPTSKWFYLYLPLVLALGMSFAKKGSPALRGLWFGMAGLLAMFANGMVHHWAAPRFDVFCVMLMLWLGGGALAGAVGGVARRSVDKSKTQNAPSSE